MSIVTLKEKLENLRYNLLRNQADFQRMNSDLTSQRQRVKQKAREANLGLFSFLPYPFVIGDMYLNSGAKRIHSGAQKVKKKKSSVYYSAGCLSLLKAQYINDTQRESPFVTRPKEGNFQARNGGLQVTVQVKIHQSADVQMHFHQPV